MALDDIPNKLLQFPKPHDTCPQQLHQAVLHPKHQSQENDWWKAEKWGTYVYALDEYPANICKFFE